MDKIHTIESIRTDETYLYLMVDGQPYRIHWTECSPRLVNASMDDRRHIEVSPSGYGLHWPLIDEDLAITPLLTQAEHLTTTSTRV